MVQIQSRKCGVLAKKVERNPKGADSKPKIWSVIAKKEERKPKGADPKPKGQSNSQRAE
jgi:hypothetical protein